RIANDLEIAPCGKIDRPAEAVRAVSALREDVREHEDVVAGIDFDLRVTAGRVDVVAQCHIACGADRHRSASAGATVVVVDAGIDVHERGRLDRAERAFDVDGAAIGHRRLSGRGDLAFERDVAGRAEHQARCVAGKVSRDANAAVAGAARPEAEIAARGVRKARRAGVERAATARGDRHVADDVRRKHRHPRIAGFGFECAAREVERASKLPAERDAHGPQAEIERICRVDLDRRRDHAWVGGRRADVVSGLDGIRDGRPAACKHDRETHQHRLFHREPSAPFGTRPLTRKSSRALSSQRLTSQVPPLPRVTTPSRPLPTDSTFSRSLSVPSTMTPLIALLLAWTLTAALSVKSRMPFSEFSLTRTPAKRPPLPRTLMPSRPLRVATTSSNTVPAIVKRTPSSWLSRSSRCVTRAIASGRAAVSPIPKPATAPRAGAFAPTICAPSVPPYIT